jgi:hypothetical protein
MNCIVFEVRSQWHAERHDRAHHGERRPNLRPGSARRSNEADAPDIPRHARLQRPVSNPVRKRRLDYRDHPRQRDLLWGDDPCLAAKRSPQQERRSTSSSARPLSGTATNSSLFPPLGTPLRRRSRLGSPKVSGALAHSVAVAATFTRSLATIKLRALGEDPMRRSPSRRAEKSGSAAELHVWQGMVHVFRANLAVLHAAREALDITADILRRNLAR